MQVAQNCFEDPLQGVGSRQSDPDAAKGDPDLGTDFQHLRADRLRLSRPEFRPVQFEGSR